MDQATLDTLRHELEQDRALQLSFLEEYGAEPYGEDVKLLQVGDDGFADAAQATEERSEVLGQIEAARHRVHQIDEALARMEQDRYGVCVVCEAEIGDARLEARPLSVRCVDCASKAE